MSQPIKYMKKAIFFFLFATIPALLDAYVYHPDDLVWTTPSTNSSESMPCGGHDIGMNVWVEDGDVLFYMCQSGWFDENNTLLKAGRWRLHLAQATTESFEQRLCLNDGSVNIKLGDVQIRFFADVFSPRVFIEINAKSKTDATLSYESWRYKDRPITKAECQQCSYKWIIPEDCKTFADTIQAQDGTLSFKHINRKETVFDFTVQREHLDSVKHLLANPLGGRIMQGVMLTRHFTFSGTSTGTYCNTDYQSWDFQSKNIKRSLIEIALDASNKGLPQQIASAAEVKQCKQRSAKWWHDFWQRSFIITDTPEAQEMVRNYELFRFLLGCNAYSDWPTKFNGSLFTFDPIFVDTKSPFTPDYRKWGGGTMTAQNQRLVYWPLLKSGDTDLMKAQFDTYLRMLPTAEMRTRCYWKHGGACFTEQIENFGLPNPAEYGKHPIGSDFGVERNAWLEYEWDTALEFCMMILLAKDYANMDISCYEPLIRSCLTFFDEHYQYRAKQRGAKTLNEKGQLILYPASGCETYKMAYNPASTIAALKAVLRKWGKDTAMLKRIPDIPLRVIAGDTCIAPAITWERVQNVETPQLYPVFPWRLYGVARPHLNIAKNTYLKDPHAKKMRSIKGWKQDNIWAACLGLTEEAKELNLQKLSSGPYRYPAFWDAGYDWAPDCNRGGAGMIGLQEMLLQETPDGMVLPFVAWPEEWNVRFRLHATGNRTIEAEYHNGTTKISGNILR